MNPQPKPRSPLRARKAQERAKAKAFRDAVWKRDGGRCRNCGAVTVRTGEWWERGEVHHLRGRNVAPEDKYNPAAACLLCVVCHERVTAHRVKVRPF